MAVSSVVNTATSRSALAWTPIVIATVVVAARIFVRVKRQAFGADDQLMILSLLFALVSAGLAEEIIRAQPQNAIEEGHLNTASLLGSATGFISLAFGKSSVAYFLLILIGRTRRWQRWFLISSLAILAFLTFLVIIAIFIPSCEQVAVSLPNAACIDANVALGYVQAWNFYGVMADFAYSTLPLAIMHSIRMSPNKKAAVIILLGLGWVAGIFTLLRALTPYNLWDPATTNFITRLATAMEQGLVIICGSLATLTPLYYYFVENKPLSPYNAVNSLPTSSDGYLGRSEGNKET